MPSKNNAMSQGLSTLLRSLGLRNDAATVTAVQNQLDAAGGGGGDPFPAMGETLKDFLEDEFEWTGVSYSHGTEQVEDIFKFDIGDFFDALDEEDPEPFKAPIIKEEGNYIVVSGTRLSAADEGGPFTILNGLLFPQGGNLVGAGSFLSFSGDDGAYAEFINAGPVKVTYAYEYNDVAEKHIHILELDAAVFEAPLSVIQVTVPDAAAIWGDVTVDALGLS